MCNEFLISVFFKFSFLWFVSGGGGWRKGGGGGGDGRPIFLYLFLPKFFDLRLFLLVLCVLIIFCVNYLFVGVFISSLFSPSILTPL